MLHVLMTDVSCLWDTVWECDETMLCGLHVCKSRNTVLFGVNNLKCISCKLNVFFFFQFIAAIVNAFQWQDKQKTQHGQDQLGF